NLLQGCDASILLDHDGSEKRARASRTLRGFSLIEEIKSNIEKVCPKKVSCADILTIAARDATVLAGGPFWEIPFGRKDGRISYAEEADSIVPEGRENITSLINLFEKSLGLTVLDLVVLSGAHTIGRSTCPSILPRVTATKAPYTQFVNSLKYKCSPKNNSEIFVNFDATTPKIFDEVYYKNLGKNMGLLLTDQLLYSDSRTSPIVKAFATQPFLFTGQFAGSMVRLGNVVGKAPYEIRNQCTSINK
ncbi:peroxidase 7-like, partial [Impatiens glandulifera]|uniref:peroxidase 7-like n=1 Tax=Impatiens glandulifera TaxID=253017 RepID=UPI001FB08BA8